MSYQSGLTLLCLLLAACGGGPPSSPDLPTCPAESCLVNCKSRSECGAICTRGACWENRGGGWTILNIDCDPSCR